MNYCYMYLYFKLLYFDYLNLNLLTKYWSHVLEEKIVHLFDCVE